MTAAVGVVQEYREDLLFVTAAVGVMQEYREDLLELPRNGWSLLGLGQALTALGSPDGQALISKDFRAAWADADVPIDSSCLSFSKF